MAKLPSIESPDASAGPLPWISVLIRRSLLACWAGMVTVGALPKAPDTVTDALGLLDDDDPHPARAAAAVSETSSAAAIRRMYILSNFGAGGGS